MGSFPNITDFSHELLCQILKYLPLREILSVAMLCKKMSTAVDMHLRLCKCVDFCQDSICGYMPSTITDENLLILLKKCPHLETVYGLHPVKIERRRLRKRSALTIPGIIEALSLCFHLKAVETSDLRLFEAIMQHLPHIEIIGHFQNRDGLFPPQASQRLKLQPYPRISSLHLIGVEVPELTAMPHLQHLHLQCVRFTRLHPFRAFLVQNLKSFVMKHCIGPSGPHRYLALIIGLSSAPNLSHLELVRVPVLNGLFQRAVEDHNGFANLKSLIISGCKGVLEADLGHLMIISSKTLETLYIQPSLTKDSLFVSLSYAQCTFPRLQNLHLGYIDTLNSAGEWSNDALLSFGLAEVPDTPSSITDSGMKVICELFPQIKSLSVSNCPHLMVMYHWMSPGDEEAWSRLTDLTLQKCHCLQLSSFAVFVAFLSHIEVVILNDMFREPPKGCSHVGLSAGTGLGMSSAVVSNQDEHIAVQGHHQDFEHPGDEENEENEREFIDVENEEPHFMVLQRDFFDGEEEEEEEDADVPLEGQDPVVREQLNDENLANVENSLNENSQEMSHDARANENSFCHSEPSTSTNSKACWDPLCLLPTEDQNVKESKNEMQSTSKDHSSSDCMKSVQVQCDTLPADCFPSSSNYDLKNAEKNIHEGDDVSNDSFRSDDVKLCVCAKRSNYNYYSDYDPHKPSTSKAGRHLDYSITTHRESFNSSDSDTDICKHDRCSKRFKKASDEKSSPKVKIEKLDNDKLTKTSESSESYDNFPKSEKKHYSKSSNNSVLHCQNHGNNSSSSLNEMYKLVKPCKVLIPKIELSPVSTSKICTQNTDTDAEFKECSFPESSLSTTVSCSSLKKDYNDEDSHKNDKSSDTNGMHNLVNSSTNETPLISPNFNESFTQNESLKSSAEISVKKINSAVNGDIPESMMCFVHVEKLANNSHEMLENSVEGKKSVNNSNATNIHQNFEECNTDSFIIKNESYIDDTCENSTELNKNCKYLEQENISSCSHMEVDNCLVSACKTEGIRDSDNFVSYDNTYLAKETTESPPVSDIFNSQKICKEEAHTVNNYETKDFCSMLDYKNSLDNNKLNEYKSNIMLQSELSLKENQPNKVLSAKNVVNSSTEGKTEEAESQAIDPICDILSLKKDAEQEVVSNSVGKNEETLTVNSDVQISKMQDEELTKTSQKRNFSDYHEPCVATKRVNLLTSKQTSSTYSEKSYEEYSSGTNVKKPCCSNTYSSIARNTRSKVSQMHDPHKPSTSRDGCNCYECSNQLPRSTKYSKSDRYKKNIPSVTPPVQHTDSSNAASFSESKDISEMQSIKNSVKGKKHPVDHSKVDVESSEPIVKKMKKNNQSKSDKDAESKYFVVVSDASTEIFNSSTGESCTVVPCCVHLTQIDIRNSNSHFSGNKTKSCEYNLHETMQNRSAVVVNCDPCSSSTSYSSRTSKENVCKDCRNMSDQLDSSTLSNSRKDKLKITNSDATVLMNNPKIKENKQLNLHSKSKCMRQNSSDNSLENGPNSNRVFKTESDVEKNCAENSSSDYQNNDIKIENVSDSTEKSAVYSYKKRTRKKRAINQKRGRKIKKDPLVMSDCSSKYLKCRAKKVPTVPMVCLISQGTQANSADIRRSVRRIRRATARTRRTVSSLRVSRNSSHSNKISAKMLNKKPVNMNPRPETHDKATSTSDPLLEDDAVQTLQLTSKSLLSFTIVSCGISDIIIDRCPKLFHFEVQACRILKKFHLNHCSSLKQFNVAQCPKLSICALVAPLMSLDTDSNFLISYEPCMQGYHPGDGEKAALSRAALNQNVVLCHDFNDISHEGIQAMFKEKLMQWFNNLSKLHVPQNSTKKKVCEISDCSEYPWSHDLRKIYGSYTYTPSSDFCHTEGQYQLLTNNLLLCDIFETHQLESGFPTFKDCDAYEDISIISRESIEKFYNMERKFIGFYIPITENNQINF